MKAYKSSPSWNGNDMPFLSLQANSLRLFNQNKDSMLPEAEAMKPLYQKPSEICNAVGSAMLDAWDKQKTMEFCQAWRKKIEDRIKSMGLEIRMMCDVDTPGILKFMEERYPPFHRKEVCAFDLFRWRSFGHGVVLVDKDQNIQGTVFENGYDTAEKTSFTIRLAVSQKWSGNGLGYQLMLYSCLLAMEKGSQVKRGIIQCINHRSLYINMNQVGWICDRLEMGINGLGNFFHIALPLNPYSLVSNCVDAAKVPAYLKDKVEGEDYLLVPVNDTGAIKRSFVDNEFKFIAFLKEGNSFRKPFFLALSNELLEYNPLD
ncbi:MAG: hypothetical protein MRZ79_18085 [Bacteroidia bacterium]|nr:hypothetical protein [Bacteroidia bacterium]